MKSAFLVGINNYPGIENDLQGCLNDITNVYDVLVKYFDFAPLSIKMLQDKRASKAAITDGLKTLVAKAVSGDTIVFHYSGHGSQVRDVHGDELSDGKDEIICPWDFDWNGTWISDDDFSEIFSGLKDGVHLEVLLDSCHSGTGTREIVLDRKALGRLAAEGFGGAAGPGAERAGAAGVGWGSGVAGLPGAGAARGGVGDLAKAIWSSSYCLRNRYAVPPADIAARADEVFGGELPVRQLGSLRKLRKEKDLNHVLWAACRSNQYSADAEIGGTPNGAFSYYFCRHVRDSAGAVNRGDLLKRVRASLKHEGYSQIPQLEGPSAEKKKQVFTV